MKKPRVILNRKTRTINKKRYTYWDWHASADMAHGGEPTLANPDSIVVEQSPGEVMSALRLHAIREVINSGRVKLTPNEWKAFDLVILQGLTLVRTGTEMGVSFQYVARLIATIGGKYKREFERAFEESKTSAYLHYDALSI